MVCVAGTALERPYLPSEQAGVLLPMPNELAEKERLAGRIEEMKKKVEIQRAKTEAAEERLEQKRQIRQQQQRKRRSASILVYRFDESPL